MYDLVSSNAKQIEHIMDNVRYKCFKHIWWFGFISVLADIACVFVRTFLLVFGKSYSLFGSNESFSQYSVQSPEIRLKWIIWFKSWIRVLINRTQILIFGVQCLNTLSNYSASIMNQAPLKNIRIPFLITPIWLTLSSTVLLLFYPSVLYWFSDKTEVCHKIKSRNSFH